MIDPFNITKFDRTYDELEEFAVFSVLVAGKTATTVAKQVDALALSFTSSKNNPMLLTIARRYNDRIDLLAEKLKSFGIGCHKAKSRTLLELAGKVWPHYANIYKPSDWLELRICSVSDLESIWGIGSKTARFFILHSRPDQNLAVLDTHILRWLRENGYPDAPKSSPPKRSALYDCYEKIFLKEAADRNKTAAQLDLEIWREAKNGV